MAQAYSLDPEFRDNLEKLASTPHRATASRLAAGQEVTITAVDHSMAPIIWPQDKMVFGFPDLAIIEAGDIVLYRRGGKLLARRVIRKLELAREDVFVTRADAGERQDISVGGTEIIGRLLHVDRQGELIPVEQLRTGWVRRLFDLERSPVLARVSDWLQRR